MYVHDCKGDYADEVTGVTLLRGDVAKARVEGNFVVRPVLEAFGEVADENMHVENRTQTNLSFDGVSLNEGDKECVELRKSTSRA